MHNLFHSARPVVRRATETFVASDLAAHPHEAADPQGASITEPAAELVARIRCAIQGHETWQVMNRAEDGFCMEFAAPEYLNPQRACERWMSEQSPAWLESNGYHAVKSFAYTGAERLALEAADMLATPVASAQPAKAEAKAAPVQPRALELSIAELEAWDKRADGEPLTISESESVGLVLHELKRLRALRPAEEAAPTQPELLQILKDELARSRLTGHPQKFAFAEEHGLDGLDGVEEWMRRTRARFVEAVESLAAQPMRKGRGE